MHEYLLEYGDGGSVGGCAPCPCGTPAGNQELALEFFRNVYERGERVVGRAVFAAKCSVITRYPTNDWYYGNAYVYTLFGDPALRLKYPAGTGVEERDEGRGLKDERGTTGRTLLARAGLARLGGMVFDMQGREVTDRKQQLAPGVYFVRDGEDGARRTVLVR